MDLYNIKLRLRGALHHEVYRQNVPAAEVVLLNALHGGAAIVNLQKSGSKEYLPRDHRVERRRLETVYGAGGTREKHLELIRNLFGGVAGALPESVTIDELRPLPEEEDDLDAPLPEAPPPANAIKQETIDAKEAVKDSIRKLGGEVPPGNVSLPKLRERLGELQLAANGAPPAEDAPEPANVLGD